MKNESEALIIPLKITKRPLGFEKIISQSHKEKFREKETISIVNFSLCLSIFPIFTFVFLKASVSLLML